MAPDDDDVHAKHGEGDDLGMDGPAADAVAAERHSFAMIQRCVEDFRGRAEGLEDGAVRRELDRLREIVRESHAGLPPGAPRTSLLEHLGELLSRDASQRRWWLGKDAPEVARDAPGEPSPATRDPRRRYPITVCWSFHGTALREPHTAIFRHHSDDLRVLTSLEPLDDGDWWHLSVTRTYERATDADIELVRRDFDMVDAFESESDPGILGRVRRIGPALRHLWLRTTPHPDGRRAPANAPSAPDTDRPSR